jgi:hypothetical protein
MKRADLLAAWREAVRATEVAEQLAAEVAAAAQDADVRAAMTAEIAHLAEKAAASAERAAATARAAAEDAAAVARSIRADEVPETERALLEARGRLDQARKAYQVEGPPQPPKR